MQLPWLCQSSWTCLLDCTSHISHSCRPALYGLGPSSVKRPSLSFRYPTLFPSWFLDTRYQWAPSARCCRTWNSQSNCDRRCASFFWALHALTGRTHSSCRHIHYLSLSSGSKADQTAMCKGTRGCSSSVIAAFESLYAVTSSNGHRINWTSLTSTPCNRHLKKWLLNWLPLEKLWL